MCIFVYYKKGRYFCLMQNVPLFFIEVCICFSFFIERKHDDNHPLCSNCHG